MELSEKHIDYYWKKTERHQRTWGDGFKDVLKTLFDTYLPISSTEHEKIKQQVQKKKDPTIEAKKIDSSDSLELETINAPIVTPLTYTSPVSVKNIECITPFFSQKPTAAPRTTGKFYAADPDFNLADTDKEENNFGFSL